MHEFFFCNELLCIRYVCLLSILCVVASYCPCRYYLSRSRWHCYIILDQKKTFLNAEVHYHYRYISRVNQSFFTTTAYLSLALDGSLSHWSTSPTAAIQIALYNLYDSHERTSLVYIPPFYDLRLDWRLISCTARPQYKVRSIFNFCGWSQPWKWNMTKFLRIKYF